MKKTIAILLSTMSVYASAQEEFLPREIEQTGSYNAYGQYIPILIDPPLKAVRCHRVIISERTSNNMGDIGNHGWVQPQFEDAVFSRENTEILEVGGANGNALQNLLQDPRNETRPFRYTSVEINLKARMCVDGVVKRYNKNKDNWFGWANKGDIREFIKINADSKKNRYDIIYCAQLFHDLKPTEHLDILKSFHEFLKPGGQLFFVQNSIHAARNWIRHDVRDPAQFLIDLYNTFRSKSRAGDVWGGFDVSPDILESHMLMGQKLKIPTLHGKETLTPLLEAIGFKVQKCFDFTECSPTGVSMITIDGRPYEQSVRIGAIAEKLTDKVPIVEKLAVYEQTAHEKEEKVRVKKLEWVRD